MLRYLHVPLVHKTPVGHSNLTAIVLDTTLSFNRGDLVFLVLQLRLLIYDNES